MSELTSILDEIENNSAQLRKIISSKNNSVDLFLKKTINSLLSINSEFRKIIEEENFLRELLKVNQEDYSLSDSEVEQINQELNSVKKSKEDLEHNAKMLLLKEEKSNENAIVEIRPGAGGLEASLFAQELYKVYFDLASKKKWKFKLVEIRVDNSGFFNFVSFFVEGKDAYYLLKNEAGVHRVQRIPKTESKGRVHTSTVTVAVLPEAEEVEIDIPANSIKIDTYRSSGAGGQHVNTTDSAVRITHLATGIVVTSQDGRSQHSNKLQALAVLRSKLLKHFQEKSSKSQGELRSLMIGNAERSEKIRTYNFPQNRLTDHRLSNQNKNFALNSALNNSLLTVCQRLVDEFSFNKLIEIIKVLSISNS